MPDPIKQSQAPTIRSIAKAAGVCAMTVSLALRDNPSAALATRLRIQKLAARMGYRPDPTISKLMTHLRVRRTRRLQALICCLTTLRDLDSSFYAKQIFSGAAERAKSLGYGIDLLCVGQPSVATPERLERVLKARGVQGVILLPMATTGNFTGVKNWGNFSVVTTSLSVAAPNTDRIIPNTFDHMLTLCRHAASEGKQRIGLAIDGEQEARVGHRISAAVSWFNQNVGGCVVPPLIFKTFVAEEFCRWYKDAKPDCIIGNSDVVLTEIERLLPDKKRGAFGLYLTSKSFSEKFRDYDGIDERPSEIGRSATELLAGHMQYGITGLPQIPRIINIEGCVVRSERNKLGVTEIASHQ